jgi:hypothetical protein
VQFCGGAPPVCTPHHQAGERCAADGECAFGLVCRGRCGNLPHTPDGQRCSDGAPCNDGSYCAGDGTCAHLRDSGAACDRTGACKAGLGCTGLPADGGVCRAWSDVGLPCVPGAAGTSCPESQTCQPGGTGDADAGVTGTCIAAAPPLPSGPHGPCDLVPCGGGLFCSAAKSCEYLVGPHGRCDPDQPGQCAAGLTCDAEARRCLADPACLVGDAGAP